MPSQTVISLPSSEPTTARLRTTASALIAGSTETQSPSASNSKSSFSLYYQNVRGLRTKTTDVYLALSQCDYDVVIFTETWLGPDISNTELSSNYTIYRCDRNAASSQFQRGGGVLIAVRNALNSAAVSIHGSECLEQMIVHIKLSVFELFACSVYIPPNSSNILYEQHCACVQRLLEQAGDRGVVVVAGDYNLPYLNWDYDDELRGLLPTNTSSEQEFTVVESLIANGMYQLNSYVNMNGRLLDLVFTSEINGIEVIEPPSPLTRVDHHHTPLLLIIEAGNVDETVHTVDPFDYDFKRCDFAALNMLLRDVRWEDLLNDCSVDEAVWTFNNKLYELIGEVVPLKKRINVHSN